MDEQSVLATVPMWFGLLDADKAKSMIEQLSARQHATDWGMRIVSHAIRKLQCGWISLWVGMATVHGVGSGGRVSLPSAECGAGKSASECTVGAGRLSGTYHGSSFRRLLPAVGDEFTAPDLVGGDGGEPAIARDAGTASGCGKANGHAGTFTTCGRGRALA